MGAKNGRASLFQQSRLCTGPRRSLHERFRSHGIGRSRNADFQGDRRVGPFPPGPKKSHSLGWPLLSPGSANGRAAAPRAPGCHAGSGPRQALDLHARTWPYRKPETPWMTAPLKALDGNADLPALMTDLAVRARAAARVLALALPEQKNKALDAIARAIRSHSAAILAANAEDVAEVRAGGATSAFIDRLTLTPARIEAMADGVTTVRGIADPIGAVTESWQRPNGMTIERVRVPLGVIAVIFESRPNVAADAGVLCLKSGNAVMLRGGSDSFRSCRAIHDCLVQGLREAGLPEAAITLVPTRDRAAVGLLLTGLNGGVDVIVPRGGKSLVARVEAEARVPVFAHLEGVNHVYVDRAADLAMAKSIVLNAKMRRPGVCGAAETLLVDRAGASVRLKPLVEMLIEAGCEVRGDAAVQRIDNRVKPASEEDWGTEYEDAIIPAKAAHVLQ